MHEYTGTVATNMDTGTIYLLILLSILDLILLNAYTYYSINSDRSLRKGRIWTSVRVRLKGESDSKEGGKSKR